MKYPVLMQLFLLIMCVISILAGAEELGRMILFASGGVYLGAVLKREESGRG